MAILEVSRLANLWREFGVADVQDFLISNGFDPDDYMILKGEVVESPVTGGCNEPRTEVVEVSGNNQGTPTL